MLNLWLFAGALLVFLIGLAHTVLGEKLLIGPLLEHHPWPKLPLRERFAKRTLRFAWHMTTLAWWGLSAMLLLSASSREAELTGAIAATLLLTGLLIAVVSRGAHFAWPVFLAASGCAVLGAHGGTAAISHQLEVSIGAVAASVMAAIGLLHLYWAVRGVSVKGSIALPEKSDGEPLFVPGRAMTALVASALLSAALVVYAATGELALPVSGSLIEAAAWILAAVFTLRLIGDFKYVGLFKRPSRSSFARWDSLLYSPLCFFLAAASAVVALG